MNHYLLSLRMLRRDWRAGELNVLVLALVIAISGLTTVGFFADRGGMALSCQAHFLLVNQSCNRRLSAAREYSRDQSVINACLCLPGNALGRGYSDAGHDLGR